MDIKAADSGEERVEDLALVRGAGCYSADLQRPDQTFGVFLRSPHAHARIISLEISAAAAAAGIVAVLTGEDMRAAGVENVAHPQPMVGRGGKPMALAPRPSLARDKVMHVGEAVALIVAETRAAAEDAAELIAVEYDELPALTDAEAAAESGALQLWPSAPGNIAIDWPGPVPDDANEAEVDRILAEAPHRVRIRAVNQRIAGVTMEPRGATAEFDAETGRYIFYCSSQGTLPMRGNIAKAMGIDPSMIRVISHHVGGGFGLKAPNYPEYPALLVAARKVGRPVHWMSTRSESFLSDNHGRDQVAAAELALDAEGRFLALKVDAVTNMGAYVSPNGAHIATANFGRCFPTIYAIPKVAVGLRCVYTNTIPTGPYRGAGRPEANYVMERLVEAAARQTGIDAIALRRRNIVPPDAMPHATALGTTIDSGAFQAILDKALALSEYQTFAARGAEAAEAGKLRGIGVSCFLEHAGAVGTESVALNFAPGAEDRLDLLLGVQSSGQGHLTVFRNLLAGQLGLATDAIVAHQGDSDWGLQGYPTVASRSAMTVSAAMEKAVSLLLEKGRRLAADQLEVAEGDVVYAQGAFAVAGTDRCITLFELARNAAAMMACGDLAESLDTRATTDIPQSFPNGCHIAEVEIDPETGHMQIIRYVAVDDCGNVLDHAVVDGQVIGSVAQGLGQAMMERLVYDGESGQLITGTFNDYVMPRAGDVPPLVAALHPVPCRTNPLGVKGVGEAGTTAAIAAVMNAIADAIPDGRGVDIDMPATAEKIWRACRG